jgi:peptidoglycan/LPS O-acetylase OafA/YrhL
MGLFGIGNLLLKFKRKKLPRPEKARGIAVVTAVILVIVAFVGNVQLNVDSFYFYQIPDSFVTFVGIMLVDLLIQVMIDAFIFTNQCVKW